MNTEEAVEKAEKFLKEKAGYLFPSLYSVKLEDKTWIIKFDIGVLAEKIVTLKLDDETGRVIEFERTK